MIRITFPIKGKSCTGLEIVQSPYLKFPPKDSLEINHHFKLMFLHLPHLQTLQIGQNAPENDILAQFQFPIENDPFWYQSPLVDIMKVLVDLTHYVCPELQHIRLFHFHMDYKFLYTLMACLRVRQGGNDCNPFRKCFITTNGCTYDSDLILM
jgi:hypothetical protein